MPNDKLVVLRAARFGQRVAEDETQDLSTYFVETDQWRRLYEGSIDVVYGTKGAGKSALYSLLISRKNELFDRNIFLIAAENPRGQPAFSNLLVDPPPTERHFVALWKLYIASLLHSVLAEYGINNASTKELEDALAREGLIKGESSLATLLKGVGDYVKRIFNPKEIGGDIKLDPVTGMPIGVGGKIVFSEPSAAEAKDNFRSVDNLLALANSALSISNYQAWVLLDRLDVAFSENQQLEVNALRALFRVYLDSMAYENFKIKIFLRTDIWERITDGGFREASHITRHTTIEWGKAALLNLIVKRALHNESIRNFYSVDVELGVSSGENQEDFFYRMCPAQIDVGSKQPRTVDWLLTRTQDGQRINAPREMVHMLNTIRNVQAQKLELGDSELDDENLFARSSFKEALPEVSKVRLEQTIYAENPNLKSFIERLKGEKTQQTPETLSQIWKNSQVEAAHLANELVKVGFFEQRGDKASPTYWVPFLYRDALGLVQGAAE